VFVFNGTYYENLIVNKTINLTGEYRDTTIIDGRKIKDVIKIIDEWVNISGFTIRNSTWMLGIAGVALNSAHNCSIFNNIVSSNADGISLYLSSNNDIMNNIVMQNAIYGINLSSSTNNNIVSNNVSNNKDGICLNLSLNNKIRKNNVLFSSDHGIYLTYSENNNITENSASHNDYAIYLSYSPGNNVTSNHVFSNIIGIRSRSSPNSHIIDNNASSNSIYGISTWDPSSSDIIIKGNNASLNGFDGIRIHSSTVKIINNTVSLNTEFGISVFEPSNNNTITGNNIFWNGREGLLFYSTKNNFVADNNFSYDGMHIMGELQYQNSHTITTSNLVNGKPLYYHKDSSNIDIIGIPVGQLILVNYSSVNVKNLQIDYADVGIAIAYVTNITITNNNISSNDNCGILSMRSPNNIIQNNNISKNGYGILLSHSSNRSEIAYNSILSNEHYGIYIGGSENNNVSGNYIYDSGLGICLHDQANNNSISNNTVSSSGWSGIILSTFCMNNTVTNNTVLSTEIYHGIYIYSDSYNNTITSNYISSSKDSGICLERSLTNKVIKNTIVDNFRGITSYSSFNNRIYHNNIINNSIQAYDDSTNGNSWDDGYPNGGNFWSDYNGTDEFRGPDQNISGSDGIGDSNYSIDSNSIDYYPLMNPKSPSILLQEGWNFISIPYIQPNLDVGTVLSSISGTYDAVQYFDIEDADDPWKHDHISKDPILNDLNALDHTMGFWIHITQPGDTIFLYNGTQPTSNQTIQLYEGWNMVGYPSLSNHNRTVGLNNLEFGTDVDAVQWFDAGTKTWHFMDQDDPFVPGRGYWVHSKVETIWEVPL
jgi:parallel beta-helix repeat protein